MKTKIMYLLTHVRLNGSEEELKLLGVYSSRKAAVLAKRRLSRRPGFKKYKQGFEIGPMVLDRDYWQDGFITV